MLGTDRGHTPRLRPFFLLTLAAICTSIVQASDDQDAAEEQTWSSAAASGAEEALQRAAQKRKAYDDEAWRWYEENAADPSTVPKLRETVADYVPYQIMWAKAAMEVDELAHAVSGVTADFLVSSVVHELIRSKHADVLAVGSVPVAALSEYPVCLRTPQPELDAVLWAEYDDLLGEHAAFRDMTPKQSAIDVLRAVFAVEMDEEMMEQTHFSAYELMAMVEYQVMRKMTVDTRIFAITQACAGDQEVKAGRDMRDFSQRPAWTTTNCAARAPTARLESARTYYNGARVRQNFNYCTCMDGSATGAGLKER